MTPRERAHTLARQHLESGDPLGWFEKLYSTAAGDSNVIPWADLAPNVHLESWLNSQSFPAKGRALTVGCGLGDDAEELAGRGFDVTAFDISPTAIDWCRRRFPDSGCDYIVANLLSPPASWKRAFDFVFEAYTLQTLPVSLRSRAMANVARFVAPGGTLLVVCRGREAGDPEGKMPFPLLRSELDGFKTEHGLVERSFEDFFDDEKPPVRRFRAVYGAGD